MRAERFDKGNIDRAAAPLIQESLMGKDVFFRPAKKVEPGTVRQKAKTSRREIRAFFPHQHLIKRGFEFVKVQNVRSRISHLRVRKLRGTPIRALMLFGEINAEDVPA